MALLEIGAPVANLQVQSALPPVAAGPRGRLQLGPKAGWPRSAETRQGLAADGGASLRLRGLDRSHPEPEEVKTAAPDACPSCRCPRLRLVVDRRRRPAVVRAASPPTAS
jgi:hypothetical protein